jgi:hypothetical protein
MVVKLQARRGYRSNLKRANLKKTMTPHGDNARIIDVSNSNLWLAIDDSLCGFRRTLFAGHSYEATHTMVLPIIVTNRVQEINLW